MSGIVDTIQKIIRQEMSRVRTTELGLVKAVYPHADQGDHDNYGVDVQLKNSGLLLKRVPVTTHHIGTVAIPNVDDLVLVTFFKGDVNQPIVIGRLYNDVDRPPLNQSNEVIFRLPLAEPDEQSILAAIRNESTGTSGREMLVEMPPKITLRLDDGKVQAYAGQSRMTLDQSSQTGGSVTVLAGRTKITLNQDGDVVVEAAGDMTLKATGNLSLEGNNVSIKGQLQTKLEAGTSLTAKATTGATLDGGVAATVKGASLSLKGITSFSPG